MASGSYHEEKEITMAKIIDFRKSQEERCMAWIREYVIIEDGAPIEIEYLLAFLVGNKVFTFDEIRAELKKRKIVIPERTFEIAQKVEQDIDWRKE